MKISSVLNNINILYREGSSDESVLAHSFENDIFLKGIPEYRIRKNHTIVDIGAHIGTFTILAAASVPEGKVYALEPNLDSFNILEKNIANNGFKNVTCSRLALSDTNGEAKLYYDIDHGNWGHSIVHPFSEKGELVNTESLNYYFESNDIAKCNLIKFNCEGAEFRILLAASDKILKSIQYYIVLFHMDLEKEHHINQLVSRFRSLGFYTEIRNPGMNNMRGWLIVVNRGFIIKMLCSLNYLLRKAITILKRIVKRIIIR